jgi:hypothetical protein
MIDKQFCTISEYREITGRSQASANRDVKSGRVPTVRIGKSVLIPMSYFQDLERQALASVQVTGKVGE